MDVWLDTDETREAVVSLEMVAECLQKVNRNVHYWKWVVIALHNALQGYMVLALKGTDGFNVVTRECRKEWIAARKRQDEWFPERRLDSLLNLYKKIQRGRALYDQQVKLNCYLPRGPGDLMLMYDGSQPFKPRGTQNKSVKLLHELRNDFIHFLPRSWLLQVSGLPRVVDDCIDIIEFLAFECGNILWHEKDLETKTRELIKKIRDGLEMLKESCSE